MNFLFVLYFFGVLLACFQDIKRREVDDWLNLGLFFSGTAYIFFNSIFSIESYAFFVFFMALVAFFLYNFRFFAGGDAKLVFALAPFFYNLLFINSLFNFFVFLIFLVLAGAVYGLFFIFYLSFKNFDRIKVDFSRRLRKNGYVRYFIISILFLLVLGFVDFSFFVLGISFIFILFLFFLTKSLERVLIVEKKYEDLQEGDWLHKDVKVGGKIILATWDGLSTEDIILLRKYRKNVAIREGIPYAPAFLIALILYFFKFEILRYSGF